MRHKQRGLTAITWIILLGLIGTQSVMALRIIPVYMNDNTVQKILEEMKADPEARGKTPGGLKALIQRRLQVNNMYDLLDNKEAFKFKKLSDGVQINLHYEQRGPIYGNLEFIATFEHEVVIPR